MIQAVSSANIQNNKSVTNTKAQSFGHKPGYCDAPPYQPKKQSALGWAFQQFATGAIISVVWDGIHNAFRAMSHKPAAVKGFDQFAKNAGFVGVAMLAASLVLNAVYGMVNRNRN